jgi:flavin reductase (DIM6/NTAB) family NADH-FMN oxidoreductase RutF
LTLKEFPLSKVFHLIEPGPVVLLTTFDKGRSNVMTMSWHLMMDFDPPIIGCVVGQSDHSFKALRKTRQCVIAIPTVEMAGRVVDVGNCSGEDVDKWERFSLTPLPAMKVAAPLVGECLYNIECRVVDTRMVGKYNLFILKGVKAWVDPKHKERRTFHANGDGTFVADGKGFNLKRRMVKFKGML